MNGGLKYQAAVCDDLLTTHGGINGGIAVLFLFNTHPPNILRSKKALTRRRDIMAMSMN